MRTSSLKQTFMLFKVACLPYITLDSCVNEMSDTHRNNEIRPEEKTCEYVSCK